jgi:hypothetical protein
MEIYPGRRRAVTKKALVVFSCPILKVVCGLLDSVSVMQNHTACCRRAREATLGVSVGDIGLFG